MTTTGADETKSTFIQLESREAYKAFYDEQGNHYGNHHLDENFPRAKFILDRLRPDDSVLELGCQTGGITRLIAPKVRKVLANELSETYLARAREVLKDYSNVTFLQGFAEDLGPKQHPVEYITLEYARQHGKYQGEDVVVAMELLEHVIDPDHLCQRIRLYLKDGGKALFSVPKGFEDPLGEHVREFTYESFKELLDSHFTFVEITDAGDWYLAEASN